jgi:creatinine amidohydrolase
VEGTGVTRSPFLADLSWDEVEQRLTDGASAILPIGAAAKEHGLHLPMNSDLIQAEWLAGRLAESHNVLIWPAITYGFYPAFRDFPGSISLSRETFITMISEIVTEIARWRPRRIFILNTGISTLEPVEAAIGGHALPIPVLHLKIHDGPRYRKAAEKLAHQAFGWHADELETSRMLAIAPDKVAMSRAEATPSGPIAGALTRQNAPSGAYGDPTLADLEKGQQLLAAMLADLDRQLVLSPE